MANLKLAKISNEANDYFVTRYFRLIFLRSFINYKY